MQNGNKNNHNTAGFYIIWFQEILIPYSYSLRDSIGMMHAYVHVIDITVTDFKGIVNNNPLQQKDCLSK